MGKADIVIRGLECQPKHFHMFSKARKRGLKKQAKQVLNEMRSDSLHLQPQLTR